MTSVDSEVSEVLRVNHLRCDGNAACSVCFCLRCERSGSGNLACLQAFFSLSGNPHRASMVPAGSLASCASGVSSSDSALAVTTPFRPPSPPSMPPPAGVEPLWAPCLPCRYDPLSMSCCCFPCSPTRSNLFDRTPACWIAAAQDMGCSSTERALLTLATPIMLPCLLRCLRALPRVDVKVYGVYIHINTAGYWNPVSSYCVPGHPFMLPPLHRQLW